MLGPCIWIHGMLVQIQGGLWSLMPPTPSPLTSPPNIYTPIEICNLSLWLGMWWSSSNGQFRGSDPLEGFCFMPCKATQERKHRCMHVCVRVCMHILTQRCPFPYVLQVHVCMPMFFVKVMYACPSCIYMCVVRVCGVCLEYVCVCVCVHVGAYRPL